MLLLRHGRLTVYELIAGWLSVSSIRTSGALLLHYVGASDRASPVVVHGAEGNERYEVDEYCFSVGK